MSESASNAAEDAEDQVADVPEDQVSDKDVSESSSESEDESSSGESSQDEPSSMTKVQTDADGNVLSEYELMRLERIRRNKERLEKLGLASSVIPKKQQQQTRKRPRKPPPVATDRSKLSRNIKRINYAEKPTKRTDEEEDSDDKPRPRKRQKKAPRMDRIVYDEFKRMGAERRQALKTAQSNLRKAKMEHKFAAKAHDTFHKKESRRIEAEQRLEEAARERKWLGSTRREALAKVERKAPYLSYVLRQQRQMEYTNEQRRDADRKMQLIDALDRFPNAVKDATNVLNLLLVERAPKAPPAPYRRKTRKHPGSADTPDQDVVTEAAIASEAHHAALTSPSNQASATINDTIEAQPPAGQDVAKKAAAKSAKRKEFPVRNVGGWVSPEFGASLKREWLDSDRSSDFYVPQVGDIVLYYPAGHHAFIKAHPDVLGKKTRNRLRYPLMERAVKESEKKEKSSQDKDGEEKQDSTSKPDAATSSTQDTSWFNEKWLTSDGIYPVICRVDKAHAEFPPDPNSEFKHVQKEDGGNVKLVWAMPGQGKKKKYRPLQLCLVVQLNPLCPVLSPKEDETKTLSIPPRFSVAMFPSTKAQSFIVPFAWAYRQSFVLSAGDRVKPKKGEWEGEITELKSLTIDTADGIPETEAVSHVISAFQSMGSQFFIQAIEGALTSSANGKDLYKLPIQDVCAIIDVFISEWQENGDPVDQSQPHDLGDLRRSMHDHIRNTLPLWNGASVMREPKRRQQICPWNLLKVDSSSIDQNQLRVFPLERLNFDSRTGLVSTINEPLRAKIEVTMEDYLKVNKEDCALFVDPVTDDVAPSYSCAVPVGMSLKRVLKRLKRDNSAVDGVSGCFYRSVDALVADLSDIGYNCVLYNSPDSEVVAKAIEVIPPCKKLVQQVSSRHLREEEARGKANEERRRLVMLQFDSSMKTDETSIPQPKSKKKKSTLSTFTTPLNKEWIQSVNPDRSWTAGERNEYGVKRRSSSTATPRNDVRSWVPQIGDAILYSKSMHSSFVKGHYQSLMTEQCIVPQFKEEEPYETEAEEIRTGSLDQVEKEKNDWVAGRVLWVRPCVPRDPASDAEINTFGEVSPLLAIGINFDCNTMSRRIQTVFWRPCILHSNTSDDDLQDENYEDKPCPVCGLKQSSFLKPAWIKEQGIEPESPVTADESTFRPPIGLEPDRINAIERCLSLLKRRCIESIPADYTDPKLCMENLKRGWYPNTRVGPKLPSFEHILCPRHAARDRRTNTSSSMHTKEGKVDLEDAQALLATQHYLPPCLSSESLKPKKASQKDVLARYQMKAENPYLCLELIRLRVEKGYYRQTEALINDIQESYVATVTFQFSMATSTKSRKNLSLMKIARVLLSQTQSNRASTGGDLSLARKRKNAKSGPASTGGVPSTARKGKSTKIDRTSTGGVPSIARKGKSAKTGRASTGGVPSAARKGKSTKIGRASTGGDPSTARQGQSTAFTKRNALDEHELALLKRIEHVRKLYATAIVCASETETAERVFGTFPNPRTRKITPTTGRSPQDKAHFEVQAKVDCMLSAISRDACLNRVPAVSIQYRLPSVKVKVRCNGSIVRNPSTPPSPSILPPNSAGQLIPQTHALHAYGIFNQGEGLVLPDYTYEYNNVLFRSLFGKPLRCDLCARCQVQGRSVTSCRLRKGHSNIDFDWFSFLRGHDGVDGLTALLEKRPSAVVAQQPLVIDTSQLETDKEVTSTEDDGDAALKGAASTFANSAQDNQKRIENSSAGGVSEQTGAVKPKPDAVRNRATVALHLATVAVQKADEAAKAPQRLSEDFIKNSFPVDPIDGHYNYCIVCGLSGDVLCCEGCPTVAHFHCVNLDAVPEGEWYCPKCVTAKKAARGEKDVDEAGDQDMEDTTNAKDSAVEEDTRGQDNGGEDVDRTIEEETKGQDTVHPFNQQLPLPSLLNEKVKLESLSQVLEELRYLRTGTKPQVLSNTMDVGSSNDIPPVDIEEDQSEQQGDKKDEPKKDEPIEIEVGSKVRKNFNGIGEFDGTVVKLQTEDDPYYQIRYTDGDEEDMTEEEVRSVLVVVAKEPAASAQAASLSNDERPEEKKAVPRRKRGRPRHYPKVAPDQNVPKGKRGRPRKYPK